jgi:hypothetical protein
MSFQFQRSDESWIVSIRKKDFPPAVGRSNAPAEISIGTINNTTGALDPWPVAYGAYGLATQSRNKPNEDWWKEMALLKLKEAAGSAAFEQARRKYRQEEASTGDFIVKLSDGREDAFHDSRRGHDWAEQELKKMPPGSRAEFFRRLSKGATPRTGYPWTEPFSAMEKNEHGVVGMAGLHGEKRRSGDFVSSRPWVVYRRVVSVPVLVGRYVNSVRAHEVAREENAFCKHVDTIDASMKKALGLRG